MIYTGDIRGVSGLVFGIVSGQVEAVRLTSAGGSRAWRYDRSNDVFESSGLQVSGLSKEFIEATGLSGYTASGSSIPREQISKEEINYRAIPSGL